MLDCLRQRVKLTGCALAALTTLAEAAALAAYLRYYHAYFRAHPDRMPREAEAGEQELKRLNATAAMETEGQVGVATEEGKQPPLLGVDVDPGAAIGVSITFLSVSFTKLLSWLWKVSPS